MKIKALVLAVTLASVIFVAGCVMPEAEPTCNTPYIQVGNECCLDQNGNSICDSEEAVEDPEEAKEPEEIVEEEPEEPEPGCIVAEDCNDNNPCTVDSCVKGECTHVQVMGQECITNVGTQAKLTITSVNYSYNDDYTKFYVKDVKFTVENTGTETIYPSYTSIVAYDNDKQTVRYSEDEPEVNNTSPIQPGETVSVLLEQNVTVRGLGPYIAKIKLYNNGDSEDPLYVTDDAEEMG